MSWTAIETGFKRYIYITGNKNMTRNWKLIDQNIAKTILSNYFNYINPSDQLLLKIVKTQEQYDPDFPNSSSFHGKN